MLFRNANLYTGAFAQLIKEKTRQKICSYFTCIRLYTTLVKSLPFFTGFLAMQHEVSEKRDHSCKWTKYKLKGLQRSFPKMVLITEDSSYSGRQEDYLAPIL